MFTYFMDVFIVCSFPMMELVWLNPFPMMELVWMNQVSQCVIFLLLFGNYTVEIVFTLTFVLVWSPSYQSSFFQSCFLVVHSVLPLVYLQGKYRYLYWISFFSFIVGQYWYTYHIQIHLKHCINRVTRNIDQGASFLFNRGTSIPTYWYPCTEQ